VPDELELNFIVALIHAERPDTPLQAAMLAQMVATHLMQMKLSDRALGNSGYIDPHRASLAAKLANAFANQTDAYLKLRGKTPKQQITVTYKREVHVHHHSHKHAHLHANSPGEGGGVSDDQSHATVAALPGSDETGNALPIPSRAREAAVSDARRAGGSAKRKG
jgi:hypothetical protein